ncbi:TrkA potassium channel-family protein [Photobacterium aphoticum]|uniref:TrkA potassium channel-family protein n=1 Tax=Photobacterium aphoticum TaxID=754436 RepID=A0A090RBZ9_9GAMM|nr:TrkA potassium channel-family protein [Photobacterium aphoticum]
MNIDVAALLHQNDILLLFVVLAVGLSAGKIRIANMQLGNSIGVLITALLFGNAGFTFNAEALNIGFMLFIFCVGIEAGPNFFGIFFRDGKHYLLLALVVVLSAVAITAIMSNYFDLGLGMATGLMAGSLTATPVLVGAKDAIVSGLTDVSDPTAIQQIVDSLSVGYAMSYLIGLVSVIMLARLMPMLQKQNLAESSQQIARERGIGESASAKSTCLSSVLTVLAQSSLTGLTAVTCVNWVSTVKPAVTSSAFAVTAFWRTLTVTRFCKKATRLPLSVTRTAMPVWIPVSVTVKKCLTATYSTCALSKKKSW